VETAVTVAMSYFKVVETTGTTMLLLRSHVLVSLLDR